MNFAHSHSIKIDFVFIYSSIHINHTLRRLYYAVLDSLASTQVNRTPSQGAFSL